MKCRSHWQLQTSLSASSKLIHILTPEIYWQNLPSAIFQSPHTSPLKPKQLFISLVFIKSLARALHLQGINWNPLARKSGECSFQASSFCNRGDSWEQCGNVFEIPTDRGFPGGAVVESLPASAGDTGSSPGLGRSHMPRSSWAREPQLLSLRIWSLCSAAREAAIVRGPRTAHRDEGWPPLATTGESPRTETKTQHNQK